MKAHEKSGSVASRRRSPLLVIAVLAGVILLLINLGRVFPRNLFETVWRYWPLALVAIGSTRLFGDSRRERAEGAVFIVVGAFLQLLMFGWLPGGLAACWPVGFLLMGLWLLLVRPDDARNAPRVLDAAGEFRVDDLLVRKRYLIRSRQLRVGAVQATLGSVSVDLREAVPADETNPDVHVDCFLAEVTLIIPKNWKLTSTVSNTFGAVRDLRAQPAHEGSPTRTATIRGSAVLGKVVFLS